MLIILYYYYYCYCYFIMIFIKVNKLLYWIINWKNAIFNNNNYYYLNFLGIREDSHKINVNTFI